MKQAVLPLFLSFLITACNQPVQNKDTQEAGSFADLVLTNGAIYTLDSQQPWVEAIAISGEKINVLGSSQQVSNHIGANTKVIDLEGKMVMPGLVDGHVHPVLGGMELATQCLFPPTVGPDVIAKTITGCIEDNPEAIWIVGGRWDSTLFRKYDFGSPNKWLDAISGDKAISLADDTGHNRWVNSKALEMVGINRDTRIPGGEIVHDVNGEPNGLLLEMAMTPILAQIDKDVAPTAAQYLEAARISLANASEYGFTGIMEAGDADQGVIAYKALDDAAQLKVHLKACIAAPINVDGTLHMGRLEILRTQNAGKNLNTDCAKLFLDGVPSEARTAAMVEDYVPEPGKETSHKGHLLVKPEKLKKIVAELDKRGFTIKAHVAGDGAVRVMLDAIAYAREVNGDSGLRHELGHSGLIHKEDIPRVKQLNAVADMSPSIWYPSPIIDSITAAVGEERAERYFAFKEFLDAGIEIIAGSDWPAVVPDMNPWTGLEAMVTRRHPEGAFPGAFAEEQAIALEEAIKINTLNGARALNLDDKTGSLQVGKYADLIVLNQNLFDIPLDEISDTQVELTLFKGEIVHNAMAN